MKLSNRIIALAAILGLLATGCTTTRNITGFIGRDTAFNKLDADGDGVISEQEALKLPALYTSFSRADTDQDNNLSKAEFKALTTRLTAIEFSRADFNGDGAISEREANAVGPSLKEAFDRVDADNDGGVSQSEYRAATVNLLKDTQLSEFDQDKDGVLDRDEAKNNPFIADNFDSLDIDGNGLISAEEYRWAQQD
ncbi:EF-hand domain-containing protein [Nitrosococcus wardiae]|uniref:EF-hand domain-containing protein n=1 Tax=Nitrosococcus wardiae TaxID=1814290 RepID=A0A4P7C3G6_9GAMM|nr:EF-hand domain-containing protein [Nitrosococcus wardiae]QBQ56217.1 hypothetical protein E3U44_18205 [Nitrosococcus wardiae]